MSQDFYTARKDYLSPYLVYPLVVLAVLVGLYFCFVGRGDVHLLGDEFHSVWNLSKPYGELVKCYDKYGSGIALPLMQRLLVDLLGKSLWAYRLPAILGAIATLLIIYPVASRLIGQVPAVITSLALSTNSMHIFYSRFGRSYALMVFLAVLVVHAINRAMSRDEPRRLWYIILALSVGLLPYLHIATAGLITAVAVAAVMTMLLRRQARRHCYWLIGSFIIGALLCILLYLPAWEPLWHLIKAKTGQGYLAYFNALDVASLLAGNRVAGLIWLVGVPIGAGWILIGKRSAALILVTAAFAPVAVVAITKPIGMTYAYARYLLPALPFMVMLLAWLLVKILHVAGLSGRLLDYIGLVIGVALVVVSFLTGPLGYKHTEDGPFENCYLSMMPLPAFDVPWDQTPPFYKKLADFDEPIRIIEAPQLLSRSVQLYRNYYLQHRKEVMIGFVGIPPMYVPGGPYVSVDDLKSIKNSNADYLILHLNVANEVASYWRFVYYKVWARMADPDVKSLMVRQSKYFDELIPPLDSLASYLRRQLGKPAYADQRIVVWKLKP